MEKADQINDVLTAFFEKNQSIKSIPAKDVMPYFIKAGIFPKDQKKGLPIRKLLRSLDKKRQLHLIPFVYPERKLKNTNWFFVRTPSAIPVRNVFHKQNERKEPSSKSNSRKNSDEHYVIDLVDEVLGLKGSRQHRFDFLLGDPNSRGNRTKLPVDVYYPELNLVVEYREHQHSVSVKHFDKPDVITVSGVHRGEQRKIYDKRRATELPKHGIKLVVISYSDFNCDGRSRIIRNYTADVLKVKALLPKMKAFLDPKRS